LIAVSTTQSGVWGNAVTSDSQISADGRYVVFRTNSSNLVPGSSGTMQTYRKDLQTGELLLVSSNNAGLEGAGGGGVLNRATISADGRFVSFESNYANLVAGADGTFSQIYVKDMQTGQINVASSTSTGSVGTGSNSIQARISSDGKYVSFRSAATNLVSGVTGWQIYRKNLETGEMQVVSTNEAGEFGAGGDPAQGASRPNMSANGRYVFFISDDTNLVAGVTGFNLYQKDMETGQIALVSRATDGTVGSALSSASGRGYGVSADGLTAIFASNATNLITGDTNGVTDIYLRDLSKAGINQLEGMFVSNQAFAQITLDATTKKLAELSSDRAKIGASMSRLTTATSNLLTTSENLNSAVSRIKDADIAEESSKLLRLKILQQTTTAILAQAKQQPELTLLLLTP
jgi:flagellin-like hook-associated protein FlgL